MSSRSDEADGDVSSSSSSYKTQTENGVAPVRTVSSRSNIIRSTLRRILRRHELLRRVDGGDKEEEENAEEEEDHGEDEDEEEAEEKAPKLPPAMTSTAAARSPARAFEFLVSPRSQLARRSANKGRGPNVANAANAANAAYLSANTSSNDYGPPALPAAAAGDGGGPSVSDAEGKAPLALVSDFSQALEEKNWAQAKTLADKILVLEEDNAMMREFVTAFAELEQRGEDLDFEVFPWANDDEDDNDDGDGSYYGKFEESDDDDNDDEDDEDDDDNGDEEDDDLDEDSD